MKRVGEIEGTILVIIICIGSTLHGQSLFESSQSGSREELVSKSFTLGGFLQSATYLSTDPETEHPYLQSAYARMGLLLDARASDWAKAHAEIRFRYGNEFGKAVEEFDLREGWVDVGTGPFVLRAGMLITPWGKGSVFNPVDRMNPKDPLVRSPDADDMQLGTWAMEGKIRLGKSMKFSATWNPMYRASRLLIDPVPLPSYVRFTEPSYPAMELKEGSYGFKYDVHSRMVDFSLYWFQGYHSWPGIAYAGFALDSLSYEPVDLALRETAYRIRMAGLDFSIPLGGLILRGEGAWMESMDKWSSQEYLPFPELSYCAELEWSSSHLTLIAGYYGKYILDFEEMKGDASLNADMDAFLPFIQMGIQPTAEQLEDAISQRVAAFNRLYNYQVEEFYHSVYALCTVNLFYDKLELQLPLIAHLETEEWILQPGIAYTPLDGLRISAGYTGMFGPGESLLDLVGPSLNAAYLSLKLSF